MLMQRAREPRMHGISLLKHIFYLVIARFRPRTPKTDLVFLDQFNSKLDI
jgi:hypothetical protein